MRDLSDETKIKATTAFGRLLNRAVSEMAERDPRVIKLKEGLEDLVRSLNSREDPDAQRPEQLTALERHLEQELRHWGVTVSIEVEPPAIEKIFELGTNLHLDDGIRTLAEQKGHGLQRAVIFALIRAWASALRTAREEKIRRSLEHLPNPSSLPWRSRNCFYTHTLNGDLHRRSRKYRTHLNIRSLCAPIQLILLTWTITRTFV